MASFLKSKLKAARDAIGKKDYKSAQEAASQVLEYEPLNYNANVFLGLAFLELGKHAECEQAYLKAIDSSPEQALAWQGISKFYERTERWQDFDNALRHLTDIFAIQNDSMKCAEALQKYIELQRARGTRKQIIDALSLLLPNSKIYAALSGLPEPEPTAPTSTTIYAIQASVQNYLPVLEEMVTLTEKDEEEKIKKEVDRRRMRLGASRPEEIKSEVGREVWESSELPSLYNEILNHPAATDDLRRTTESKLLRRKNQHLKSITGSEKDARAKGKLLAEVESLSNGMVLLGLPDELAWTIVLEGSEGYDSPTFRRFIEVFPSSSLTRLLLGYFKYKGIPLSLTEDMRDETSNEESNGPLSDALETDPFSVILDIYAELPNSLLACRIVSESYHEESDHENAIKTAESGIDLLNKFETDYGKRLPRVRKDFMTVLATGLVHDFPPKHHIRALRVLDDVLKQDANNVSCLMGRGYVLQYSSQWSEAKRVFSYVNELQPSPDIALEAQEERAWCEVKLGELEQAASDLQTVIKSLDEEPGKEHQKARAWWRLGSSLWEAGSREEAYKHYITALKRCSTFAPAFTSLGVYYADVVSPPDLDRSSKCFQKAFELDSREAEAARRLAEGFAEEQEWDLVEVVSRRTIEGEGGLEGGDSGLEKIASGKYLPTNAWAWKALGVVELNRRNYASATRSFQVALRADQEDFVSWQRLGESYARSGRHAASIKALRKALDLKPDDWMCLYWIGEVHRLMGQYQSSIDVFERILAIHPAELCVLCSLAETRLAHGRGQSSEGFLSRAEASFVASLAGALDIFEKSPGFRRIAWKTAADSVFELSKIVLFHDAASVKESLSSLASMITFAETDDFIKGTIDLPLTVENLDSSSATQLAVAAYNYRISLDTLDDSTNSSVWFDLGVALQQFSKQTTDKGKSVKALKQVSHCFQKAADIDPGNCDYWNALGNLHFVDSPKQSQNAYIRALECDSKNTLIWTNLGLLYLHHEDIELANEALFRAQTLDPDFVLSWVGQGLIATANGHHFESSALLEHAISLSAAIPAADFEYAKRVFKTMTNSHVKLSTDNLLPAFHALNRYCKQRPNDATALHMFGLLCERLNQLDLAVDLVSRSITILEEKYEESEDAVTEERFAFANGNLGRLRLSIGDFIGAIEAFGSALSLLPVEVDDPRTKTLRAHAHFGSGLAHFKTGELETALTMFETALEELPSGMVEVRGHVTILLSKTLWALGSDEARQTAQGQLLECISTDPENLMAITSLVAMGVLECDDTLVDAALSEIRSLTLDKRAELDPGRLVPQLLVGHHLSQNREKEALIEAQRAVHEQPLDGTARRALARLLIQRGDTVTASAIVPGDEMAFARESMHETLRIAAVAAAAVADTRNTALRLAQKAVVLAPWDTQSWTALAYIRCRQAGI